MLTTDTTYLQAKEIKANRATRKPEFEHLHNLLISTYNAELLNGDVYHEPIFKDLGPSIRLIIDYDIDQTNLPRPMVDRKYIAEAFLRICETLGLELEPTVSLDSLRVNYVEFESLQFDEARMELSNRAITEAIQEPEIVELINYGAQYFFFFNTEEILSHQSEVGFQQRALQAIEKLLLQKGVKERYLPQLSIHLDEIESLKKAGSVYNYLR